MHRRVAPPLTTPGASDENGGATGRLFGALTIAHLSRMVVEQTMTSEPWYLAITAAAAALGLWGVKLLRKPGQG
ncbi:MAG: hypothetical protein ABJC74_06050 [Gemmatimonadota bacterium]